MQYAIIISKTVFVENNSPELALAEGQRRIEAGEGLTEIKIEQTSE